MYKYFIDHNNNKFKEALIKFENSSIKCIVYDAQILFFTNDDTLTLSNKSVPKNTNVTENLNLDINTLLFKSENDTDLTLVEMDESDIDQHNKAKEKAEKIVNNHLNYQSLLNSNREVIENDQVKIRKLINDTLKSKLNDWLYNDIIDHIGLKKIMSNINVDDVSDNSSYELLLKRKRIPLINKDMLCVNIKYVKQLDVNNKFEAEDYINVEDFIIDSKFDSLFN